MGITLLQTCLIEFQLFFISWNSYFFKDGFFLLHEWPVTAINKYSTNNEKSFEWLFANCKCWMSIGASIVLFKVGFKLLTFKAVNKTQSDQNTKSRFCRTRNFISAFFYSQVLIYLQLFKCLFRVRQRSITSESWSSSSAHRTASPASTSRNPASSTTGIRPTAAPSWKPAVFLNKLLLK